MQRTENGYPMRNSPARLLDVLSLLSGVNFGSIEKIIAALQILENVRGEDLALYRLDLAPTGPAIRSSGREDRIKWTEDEVAYLLKHWDGKPEAIREILMLDVRFDKHGLPVRAVRKS